MLRQGTELYRSGDYIIECHYETSLLSWSDGNLDIGDHYGDPSCALINAANGWCLTGGEGLVICLFPYPLTLEHRPTHCDRLYLWRREYPPSEGDKCWFVEGAWLLEGDVVRVLVDPVGPGAGLYDVNVRTLSWKRLS